MEWKQPAKPAHRKTSSGQGHSVCEVGADRRSEERYSADGEVNLAFEDPIECEITGTLLDYSRSGFRALHHYSELRPGQLVRFRHVVASGTAKVIWNRILPERVESGFLIVPAA